MAEKLLKEVALNKGTMTEIHSAPSQLGFREIHFALKLDYLPKLYGLPASFTIANGASILESKSREMQKN